MVWQRARMDGILMYLPVRKRGVFFNNRGTAVAQWLRCCATNRKIAGSIPAGVIGIFFPSDRTMALGSTEPLT